MGTRLQRLEVSNEAANLGEDGVPTKYRYGGCRCFPAVCVAEPAGAETARPHDCLCALSPALMTQASVRRMVWSQECKGQAPLSAYHAVFGPMVHLVGSSGMSRDRSHCDIWPAASELFGRCPMCFMLHGGLLHTECILMIFAGSSFTIFPQGSNVQVASAVTGEPVLFPSPRTQPGQPGT